MIHVFDTAAHSDNLGDQIIMDSVWDILHSLFPGQSFRCTPSHRYAPLVDLMQGRSAEFSIVGGTNILNADTQNLQLSVTNLQSTGTISVAGPDGGDVTIHNHPLCVAPGYPAVVARSKRVQFRDFDLKLEVSGKNGFYSPFAYQSA